MSLRTRKEANGRHSGLQRGPLGLGIMADSHSKRTKIGSNGLTVGLLMAQELTQIPQSIVITLVSRL